MQFVKFLFVFGFWFLLVFIFFFHYIVYIHLLFAFVNSLQIHRAKNLSPALYTTRIISNMHLTKNRCNFSNVLSIFGMQAMEEYNTP